MDIDTFFERKNAQEAKEKSRRELEILQRAEIKASLENIKFAKEISMSNRRIAIATLIVSIISLLVAVFK
ncbi:MAG: hypothetical protein J6J77_05200 [Alistipes sp.]|nr:hypothetical protein [Alistipes sp.]